MANMMTSIIESSIAAHVCIFISGVTEWRGDDYRNIASIAGSLSRA